MPGPPIETMRQLDNHHQLFDTRFQSTILTFNTKEIGFSIERKGFRHSALEYIRTDLGTLISRHQIQFCLTSTWWLVGYAACAEAHAASGRDDVTTCQRQLQQSMDLEETSWNQLEKGV